MNEPRNRPTDATLTGGPEPAPEARAPRSEARWPLAVPAILSAGFLWLWPHLFHADASGIHAGLRTVWADFAAHLTFAQRFAGFPPELWFEHHPLYYGVHFDYPFLTGLFSGAVLRWTGSEVAGLLVPTMVAAAALPWLVYGFLRTAGVNGAWAAAGTLLFYLAGGLGWTAWLGAGAGRPPDMEASMVQGTLFEFGRLLHLLLPQRALQLGLPIGLLVIIGLSRLARPLAEGATAGADRRWPSPVPQVLLGVVAGLLFAVHVHSFLAVAVATATLVVMTAVRRSTGEGAAARLRSGVRVFTGFLPFAGAALAVSATLYAAFVGGMRGGFLRFDPGWLAGDAATWLGLWWSNTGVFYLAAAYVFFTGRLWARPLAAACAVAGWLLFAAVNLIGFQPWDWDNTKLEIWAFLLLLPGVMLLFQSWWRNWRAQRAALVVLFSLLPTGMLDLEQVLAYERHNYRMWSAEERELARRLKGLMAPGELVLVADRPHEWVSALAGGQILLGYGGWLWSYGIDGTERRRELGTLFKGGKEALRLMERYGIRWAVIDDEARRAYGVDEAFFARRFTPVIEQGETIVYDLGSAAGSKP